MQTGKNDTNDKKFANLATENYGRKYHHTGFDNLVSGRLEQLGSGSG